MLLIPDIHINHKCSDQILQSIDKYISDNSEEKNIVFLGDYIYMFNLDTNAINRLLDLIIKHFHDGKNIYILAGNHDWIQKDFVYAQAQKVFDILNKSSDNKIYFITEPLVTNIESKDILFLPYMISKEFMIFDQNKNIYMDIISEKAEEAKKLKGEEVNLVENDISSELLQNPISQTIFDLKNHKNFNHQMSWIVNHVIHDIRSSYKNLVVIHHYYIHGIELPGIQSRFDYGDVALSPARLDDKNISLISGHIHKPFQTHNYLCCGSVWHTTANETDQVKFLRRRDTSEDQFFAEAIYINPYINLESKVEKAKVVNNDLFGELFDWDKKDSLTFELTNQIIDQKYEEIISDTKKNFYNNIVFSRNKPNYKNITINLYTDILQEDLQNYIWAETISCYKEIKIKKKATINKIDNIDTTNIDLQNSFATWQQIAKKYISDKYGSDADIYLDYLKKLNIEI